jgi:gamma-resorcylate decarboxylase
MKNKIVLEEHFATPDTIGDSQEYFPAEIWPERRRQLLDFQTERVERMDACGIGFAILSLNAPAIQGIPDSAKAIDVARRANDILAEQVAAQPNRFGAFAALPMQDPDAAAAELHRTVKELGFLRGWSMDSAKSTALTTQRITTFHSIGRFGRR